MKAVRLAELGALLAAPEFRAFWDELRAARDEASRAEAAYEDALANVSALDFRAELAQKNGIDTLYRAGELEDASASLLAESTNFENKGLSLVGDFEDQRYRTSGAWYRLTDTERGLEEKRELLSLARERGDAGLAKLAAEVERLSRQLDEARSAYQRESEEKDRLWGEVENQWARATELSLLTTEKLLEAQRIKRRAEELFRAAEERKAQSKSDRARVEAQSRAAAEARRRVEQLVESAGTRFGCVGTERFLYFRHRDQQKSAFAVALQDDSDFYNIEVEALHVYQVDRQRGAAFLEPAVSAVPSLEEGDRRFEEYFLHGRKGQAVRKAG